MQHILFYKLKFLFFPAKQMNNFLKERKDFPEKISKLQSITEAPKDHTNRILTGLEWEISIIGFSHLFYSLSFSAWL